MLHIQHQCLTAPTFTASELNSKRLQNQKLKRMLTECFMACFMLISPQQSRQPNVHAHFRRPQMSRHLCQSFKLFRGNAALVRTTRLLLLTSVPKCKLFCLPLKYTARSINRQETFLACAEQLARE